MMRLGQFDTIGLRAAQCVNDRYTDCEVSFYSGFDTQYTVVASLILTRCDGTIAGQYDLPGIADLLGEPEAVVEQALIELMCAYVQGHSAGDKPS